MERIRTSKTRIWCQLHPHLASNDLKCDEKFLTEINHKNISSIFQHLTQCHGALLSENGP
jgi:hypothetical protein